MITGLRQTRRIQARGQTDQENRSILFEDFLNERYPNMNLVDIAEQHRKLNNTERSKKNCQVTHDSS